MTDRAPRPTAPHRAPKTPGVVDGSRPAPIRGAHTFDGRAIGDRAPRTRGRAQLLVHDVEPSGLRALPVHESLSFEFLHKSCSGSLPLYAIDSATLEVCPQACSAYEPTVQLLSFNPDELVQLLSRHRTRMPWLPFPLGHRTGIVTLPTAPRDREVLPRCAN